MSHPICCGSRAHPFERYRRQESSVEEALIKIYLAGVSVHRAENITEALWDSKVSPATISKLNKKAYTASRTGGTALCRADDIRMFYVDGIYLRRNLGREYENVSIGWQLQ